jgi:hypothetical protein
LAVEVFPSKPLCVLCSAALDAGARKCSKCGAFQDGRECVTCGSTLSRTALRCIACKTLQSGSPCRACGDTIETRIKRCASCGSWQNWRRYFSGIEVTIALILSLVTVIGATVGPVINAITNRSETSVRVVGDSNYAAPGMSEVKKTIRVLVVNNGRKPSIVKAARIAFRRIDAQARELTIANNEDMFVRPDQHVYLFLSTDVVRRVGSRTKTDVLEQVDTGEITITLDIEETGWRGKFVDDETRHTVPANRIKQWMVRYVSSSS